MIRFILNNTTVATDAPPAMVLLDFIRYHQHLMGTKIGCREGDCGACTILVGSIKDNELVYQSMTSCLLALGNVHGKHIVTIEGINMESSLNPVQEAMASEGATQCGFCTPGFVVSLAGFCLGHQEATTQRAIASIDGNICRCTGYKSIERAAGKIAEMMSERKDEEPSTFVARKKILPEYFSGIKKRLHAETNGQFALTGNVELQGDARAVIVGGGTDLYVQQHDTLPHNAVKLVLDDNSLKGITKNDDRCIIGASVTVTELASSPIIKEVFPEFNKYVKLISSTPIRNMATIAGNIVNASPIGDFTVFFLALDATLVLSNGITQRELPLREFYTGYKKLNKQQDEYISHIFFQLPSPATKFHFEKVSKRTHLDIASVNTAVCLQTKGNLIVAAGLSAGGVAPIPLYLKKTSGFLEGKTVSPGLVDEAVEIIQQEISPISDARGSKEYKSLLLSQLVKAHFIKLFPEISEAILLSR